MGGLKAIQQPAKKKALLQSKLSPRVKDYSKYLSPTKKGRPAGDSSSSAFVDQEPKASEPVPLKRGTEVVQ